MNACWGNEVSRRLLRMFWHSCSHDEARNWPSWWMCAEEMRFLNLWNWRPVPGFCWWWQEALNAHFTNHTILLSPKSYIPLKEPPWPRILDNSCVEAAFAIWGHRGKCMVKCHQWESSMKNLSYLIILDIVPVSGLNFITQIFLINKFHKLKTYFST